VTAGDAAALGLRIRDRRDLLGLTAAALGDRVGMAGGSIYAIERGRVPRRASRAALERELLWRPGSIETVLAGGEPDALPEPSAHAIEASAGERLLLQELRRLPPPEQAIMHRSVLALIRIRLDEESLHRQE
jgi:transcriptional regulator with XRE-family HTH domain